MMFSAETAGRDALGLRGLCERYVDSLWLADHLLPHELEASALDSFKRAVAAELELLDVRCN